jgi:outer membrane immunogenic protein
MKKILLATLAATALASSASAADLPGLVYKAPPVVPVWSWTGFYIGVNAGGSVGVFSSNQLAAFTNGPLGTNGLLLEDTRLAAPGAVLGGQVGFNWQVSNWVWGAEVDWQWTSEKASHTFCTPAASTVAFFGAGANGFGYCSANEQKIKNFGTARARAGFTGFDNSSLWYVTGGAAWASVDDSHLFTSTSLAAIFPAAADHSSEGRASPLRGQAGPWVLA